MSATSSRSDYYLLLRRSLRPQDVAKSKCKLSVRRPSPRTRGVGRRAERSNFRCEAKTPVPQSLLCAPKAASVIIFLATVQS